MSFYIIIRGPLGCEKTTISKKLAEEIEVKYFSIDKVLDENGITSRLVRRIYFSKKLFEI